jgi:Zn-dependent peptidase ImmA (M78 family)
MNFVWSGPDTFGIVSHAKTDRQKFQRAFAQSLLCPFEDLRYRVDLSGPQDDQIEAAARYYHVHRNVVRTLLVNKGFLPRETLAEQLEAV